MTIGLQAYLQGYMHEKTAARKPGTGIGFPASKAKFKTMLPAPTSQEKVVAMAKVRQRQAERANYIASPATEDDLFRRYGRAPKSTPSFLPSSIVARAREKGEPLSQGKR